MKKIKFLIFFKNRINFLYAAHLIDDGKENQALNLLEELEKSDLHNSEDYLLEVACILKSKITKDSGMKKQLLDKANFYCEEYNITDFAKDRACLFTGELEDFES